MDIFDLVCMVEILPFYRTETFWLFAFNFFQMQNCTASFNVVDFGNSLKNLSQKSEKKGGENIEYRINVRYFSILYEHTGP